ncbi:hypothetical protein EVAR_77251_1 [Eumeta japonica]|uniref:Retinol dehydrogenase 13 n=1 Tax=Eumeta variegata TaxID=151549 RepID=A0A4C1UMB3_EUMVA|nr:hypothetical protein EVAR_77251_1 [Eumeta japonica]
MAPPAFCKSRVHLVGKVAIVTGANTGIGYETAKDFAERGARVILACRDPQKGNEAKEKMVKETDNENVVFKRLDLASLHSVREFAKDTLENEERLDILVNNAGAYGLGKKKTEDGLNVMIQVNHLGPFLLTCLLVPLMRKSAPSRIVNVSSTGHKISNIDVTDLNMTKTNPNHLWAYGKTKLCNVLMAVELARRLEGTGVIANSCHPGVVKTDIGRNNVSTFGVEKMVELLMSPITPWEGAQTSIHLAVCRNVKVSGKYFSDCKEEKPSSAGRDTELAKKLWIESAKLVGCSPDI